MRTICSQEIFTKKCRQQQNFDSDPKEAWHYNHVTFTPINKNLIDLHAVIHGICWTYDQCKGGHTRELQSRMVPSHNNRSSHLNVECTSANRLFDTFYLKHLYGCTKNRDLWPRLVTIKTLMPVVSVSLG